MSDLQGSRRAQNATAQRHEAPAPSSAVDVGVDVGGTFTDFVGFRGRDVVSLKLPSTRDPSETVVEGLQALGAARMAHGTTVATNAILERKGARTAFVTTEGFEHLLLIGRQNRPSLYDLRITRPAPPIPRERCFGLRERVDARGRVLRSPTKRDLAEVVRKVRSSGGRVRCDLPSLLLPPSCARAATREGSLRFFGLDEPRSPRRVPRIRAIVDDGPRRLRETARHPVSTGPGAGRSRRLLRDEVLRGRRLASGNLAPTRRHGPKRTRGGSRRRGRACPDDPPPKSTDVRHGRYERGLLDDRSRFGVLDDGGYDRHIPARPPGRRHRVGRGWRRQHRLGGCGPRAPGRPAQCRSRARPHRVWKRRRIADGLRRGLGGRVPRAELAWRPPAVACGPRGEGSRPPRGRVAPFSGGNGPRSAAGLARDHGEGNANHLGSAWTGPAGLCALGLRRGWSDARLGARKRAANSARVGPPLSGGLLRVRHPDLAGPAGI